MPQVFSAIPISVMMFGKSLGLDSDVLLERSGLSKESLAYPDKLVPYGSILRIWEYILASFPGEALGLQYSRIFNLRQMGVVGNVILHSPTLGVAVDRMEKLQRLIDPYFEIKLTVENNIVRFCVEHELRVKALVEPIEGMIGHLISFVDAYTHNSEIPLEITLAHKQTHRDDLYLERWRKIPRFNASDYSVSYSAHILEKCVVGADPQSGKYIFEYAKHLDKQMARHAPNSIAKRLEEVLISIIDRGDLISLKNAANRLNLSVRTLQRRLGEEKVGYNTVLEHVRKAKAFQMLASGEVAIYEIAFLLGFNEQSSFNRAFNKWSAMSPDAYRKALLEEGSRTRVKV